MNDTEYFEIVERTLSALETRLEEWADERDVDLDMRREGNVLTLDFDVHGKVIVNAQPAMQELWLAAKSGGFHFRWDGTQWMGTRDSVSFQSHIAQAVLHQTGQSLELPSLP